MKPSMETSNLICDKVVEYKSHIKKGVSIIIPTKNNDATLEILLKSIFSVKRANIEVIVVDSCSDDKTKEIASSFNCKFIISKYGRSQSRNIGTLEAIYDKVLFLDSDMEVTNGVIKECINELSYDAIIFREITLGTNLVARLRRFERIGFFKTLYSEAPRCFKKEIFFRIGGFRDDLEGFEDLELNNRLIISHIKIGWSNETIFHHEENLSVLGYVKKRNNYLRYLNKFKEISPNYYSKLSSFEIRAKAFKNSIKYYGLTKSVILIPLVLFLRAVELIFSKFNPKSPIIEESQNMAFHE